MTANPLLLGIDLGTSGLKAVVVDARGQLQAQAWREYTPAYPRPRWAEQDPDTWFHAAQAAVRECVARTGFATGAIAGIGFSGQMHSTVFLDGRDRPARPAILWLDSRSNAQVDALRAHVGVAQLAQWTGNPVMPGFMLASLLWLQQEDPHTWARVAHVLPAKDYLRLRLTGDRATDYGDASATGLLDVRRRCWSTELLDATGLPPEPLPCLAEATEVTGRLGPDAARALGLPAGIPVVCGTGDQQAQAVGNAIIRPGLVSATIGTGGQLFAPLDAYRHDPDLRLHVFCHAVPGLWHWEAASLTAGAALRWLRDNVLDRRYSYSELASAAAAVAPGAEGLMFLPYLAGERTPYMDPNARGVFYGLTLQHTWRHMARAVMEGAVLALAGGLALMRALGTPVERVVASGGATQHPLWLQLQADIFGLEVVRAEAQEAAAFGAALLAGAGTGVFPDLATACAQTVRWNPQVVRPDPARHAFYAGLAERYGRLYPALREEFRAGLGTREQLLR